MGYRIETYSLSELSRISTPGKVVPALFWLIPVGNWEYSELERLWHHFTQRRGRCNEMGLMLVKDKYNRGNIDVNSVKETVLSEMTGKLADLLPSGINTIYNNDYIVSNKKNNQVLILSGAYPQPGWGVLISFKEHVEIEEFLERTLNEIHFDIYTVFRIATLAFKNWEESKNKMPIKPEVRVFVDKNKICIELVNQTESLLRDIETDNLNSFHYQTLKKISREIQIKEFSEKLDPLFEKADDKFIISVMILRAHKEMRDTEINNTLFRFITEHNPKTNNLFKSESNEQLKKTASLLLKLEETEKPKENFIAWAENIYNARIDDIIGIVKNVKNFFTVMVGDLTISTIHLEENYKSELAAWRDDLEKKRLFFHKNLQGVIKSHWEYGPSFLINLEIEAKKRGASAKSVSWDPARMVGWKILTAGMELKVIDIAAHVKEIIPEFANETNSINYVDDNTLLNGSLFTDYVHYISKSDPKISAREITKNLLKRLLRTSEIASILKNISLNIPLGQTNNELIEALLVNFGWPAKENHEETTLAACVRETDGKYIVNPHISGNDIRIISESYCKDLIDTLSSKLGYTEKELWDMILFKRPEYKGQNQGWNYEINKITIGGAIIILNALLDEALPEKKDVSDLLLRSLNDLSKKLNPLSHHSHIQVNTSDLINEIVSIINCTKELVSEMPWHFNPIQRNGQQPSVLTGNAWSHSYKQSRQLSIILWNGEDISDSMLIWNPTKINPVVPDAIIINRP